LVPIFLVVASVGIKARSLGRRVDHGLAAPQVSRVLLRAVKQRATVPARLPGRIDRHQPERRGCVSQVFYLNRANRLVLQPQQQWVTARVGFSLRATQVENLPPDAVIRAPVLCATWSIETIRGIVS